MPSEVVCNHFKDELLVQWQVKASTSASASGLLATAAVDIPASLRASDVVGPIAANCQSRKENGYKVQTVIYTHTPTSKHLLAINHLQFVNITNWLEDLQCKVNTRRAEPNQATRVFEHLYRKIATHCSKACSRIIHRLSIHFLEAVIPLMHVHTVHLKEHQLSYHLEPWGFPWSPGGQQSHSRSGSWASSPPPARWQGVSPFSSLHRGTAVVGEQPCHLQQSLVEKTTYFQTAGIETSKLMQYIYSRRDTVYNM